MPDRQFMDELSDYLSIDKITWMLRNKNNLIHELGLYLLFPDGEKKSPFIDQLTLSFWTNFLGDSRMHDHALSAIQNQFEKRDITKLIHSKCLASTSSHKI